MSDLEQLRDFALDRVAHNLELMRASPSEQTAWEIREAANIAMSIQIDIRMRDEADALAKEMSPQPTVRVLLRNATGGGQFVNWPADHPALKMSP